MLPKEKRRGCNCIKSDVCPHYNAIISAASSIIYMRYGGIEPFYDKIIKLIESSCIYREQNKKRWKRQSKNSPKLNVKEFRSNP